MRELRAATGVPYYTRWGVAYRSLDWLRSARLQLPTLFLNKQEAACCLALHILILAHIVSLHIVFTVGLPSRTPHGRYLRQRLEARTEEVLRCFDLHNIMFYISFKKGTKHDPSRALLKTTSCSSRVEPSCVYQSKSRTTCLRWRRMISVTHTAKKKLLDQLRSGRRRGNFFQIPSPLIAKMRPIHITGNPTVLENNSVIPDISSAFVKASSVELEVGLPNSHPREELQDP